MDILCTRLLLLCWSPRRFGNPRRTPYFRHRSLCFRKRALYFCVWIFCVLVCYCCVDRPGDSVICKKALNSKEPYISGKKFPTKSPAFPQKWRMDVLRTLLLLLCGLHRRFGNLQKSPTFLRKSLAFPQKEPYVCKRSLYFRNNDICIKIYLAQKRAGARQRGIKRQQWKKNIEWEKKRVTKKYGMGKIICALSLLLCWKHNVR